MNAPTIIGGYTTQEVRNRMDGLGKQHGYQIEEWLEPAATGGLKVCATRKIKGAKHGLGFKWDGVDLNELAARCMALDLSMTALPEAVAKSKGEFARWPEAN